MHVSIIFLIFIEVQNAFSQVTFQKGYSSTFYYVGNDLNLYNSDSAGRSLSVYYSFPVAFSRTPKVYMVITLHDYWCAFPVGYQLDINSITTSGFIVTVIVPHSNKYYGIAFYWYAFDDLRRTVISAFNQNPQSLYTFSHSNINFARATVSLVSFLVSGNGYMNVRTQIDSITTTSVSVKVSSHSSLAQVGFQILIGTQEAMYVGPSIQYPGTGGNTIIDYPSGWTGTDYLISIEGMAWDGKVNLRIRTAQIPFGAQLLFQAAPWADSYFDQLYINYFFTLEQWNPGTFDSMLCIDYFLQKILDEEQALSTKLTLTTLAQTLVPTQTQTYSIDKNTLELNIEIIAKCYGAELWYMKVLKCDNQYQTYLVQCRTNQGFNSHRHLIKFRQNDQVNQKITVTVTSNYIQITQNIVDYYEQNPVILDLRY